ncbi:DUF4041 domain-containing protein [Clostridium perfringens]|uniref:DUF4041 domain-containing protein n=1 Tax=Clostridium perfringens TaxID=1502 RepID=UPI001A204052|nr:DUF4041 domain-containing protein [Clostridium perfringens]MDT9337311.1 DUF4041 domain-containing protein [Clostridium perfringens]MDT9345067.1 DUF4041 domain-containing protein [Clostridium perfringens]MDT9348189.1 DUF4041 domain-containing protein [Clostridium perfringens]MDT9354154.1 DUF4041 domain-containing protein [Clostridium perfringens]HAT4315614.1 DUF4041 domain-containing protein [Clostridium perfringens]
MDKRTKGLFITLIIVCFISGVIPLAGIITGIIAIVLFNSYKKKNELSLSNLELEKELKNKKEELKSIEVTKTSELNKIEDFKKQYEILNDITNLGDEKGKLQIKIAALNDELKDITNKINITSEILNYENLEKELYVFQVGVFEKKYEYDLSEEYNEQLKLNRLEQKEFIKSGKAINNFGLFKIIESNLRNSEKNKFENSICKLILRAFNNECDIVISKLTIANIANSRKRLESAKEQINKLVSSYNLSINMDYFKLKVDELQLQYEYLVKVQEEREEQREIKERMREEAKVQAEINKLEKEAEKEERMYQKALEKVRAELEKANDEEKSKLEIQIKSLEENLRQAEEKMKRAESMAQKTRAGYVYVISNIGSFGEDVYKIGLTRRLDPMERVKELSDASVPFKFDVHAMIYSEDAPTLEKDLHNHFADKRLNKVNLRKEFFNVKLADIEDVVNKKMNATIKFTKLAEALEYRQSKLM